MRVTAGQKVKIKSLPDVPAIKRGLTFPKIGQNAIALSAGKDGELIKIRLLKRALPRDFWWLTSDLSPWT